MEIRFLGSPSACLIQLLCIPGMLNQCKSHLPLPDVCCGVTETAVFTVVRLESKEICACLVGPEVSSL